jgi:hypothetical protein
MFDRRRLKWILAPTAFADAGVGAILVTNGHDGAHGP